jgi:hypothetical protein
LAIEEFTAKVRSLQRDGLDDGLSPETVRKIFATFGRKPKKKKEPKRPSDWPLLAEMSRIMRETGAGPWSAALQVGQSDTAMKRLAPKYKQECWHQALSNADLTIIKELVDLYSEFFEIRDPARFHMMYCRALMRKAPISPETSSAIIAVFDKLEATLRAAELRFDRCHVRLVDAVAAAPKAPKGDPRDYAKAARRYLIGWLDT